MSEIVNEATIKVTADASGVESGLQQVDAATSKTEAGVRRIEDAAQKTGRTLENLANLPGVRSVGEGAGAAAGQVDRATKNMADAIQRATASMSAGAKGSREYYEALANSRGVNINALRPYLDQLDAATRKAALAAEAQKKLDDSTRFLEDLRGRADSIGKTASQLMEMRAAQLGVADAARPMIEQLRAAEQQGQSSFGNLSEMAGKFKDVMLTIAATVAAALAAGGVMVNDAIDGLAQLDDIAQKTGDSVEALSKIQKLAEVFGTDMGEIDGALVKLAKNMTTADEKGSKFARAMGAIGLSIQDIKNKKPAEQLVEIANALQGYKDGTGKAAIMTDLINKSAADLLPFLNDLAENYGKVAGVSGEAAGAAAGFQDQLGWIKKDIKEVFTAIAVDALPALSDLVGAFSDVYKKQTDLAGGDGKKWADELGLGIAQAADAAVILGRSMGMIWNAVKGVKADIMLSAKFRPSNLGGSLFKDGSIVGYVKKALAERNQAVEEANAKIEELFNRPVGQFEDAYRARMKARGEEAGAAPGTTPKPELNYESGDDAAKNAEKAAEAYASLTQSINEKIRATAAEAQGLEPLAESQKLQIALDEQLASGKLKLSKDQEADYRAKVKELSINEAIIDGKKRMAKHEAEWEKIRKAQADAVTKSIADAEAEADRNERAAETYGMSRTAIEEQTLARLEDQLAQRSSLGLTLDEIESLEKLIAAKRRSVEALRNVEIKDAAKTASEEWKRAAASIEQTLTDALLRGFESGKGFGKNLVDTIKNMFNTLVLRPIVSAVVNPVAGAVTGALGMSGTASAATGGGGLGSAGMGALGAAAGSFFGAGGLTGSIMAGAGWLTGATTLSGSLAAAGSLAATGTLGGIASSIGMVAGALGPIALGIGAAVAIWKKFDTSGTYHTGGASSASSNGVSTIRAESLGFQSTKVSNEANSMTAQLASGIVSILDSTALAFGKTAGYSAATAFADDTSKDGAWGALVIQKMGQDIIDWNDTRRSKWAPKEFADGEKGQQQYLAALGASVRTALNLIELPDWARTMLNGVASDASLEDLAKVVEQINATQSALSAMRAQLVGFSSLSDTAVSALMAASGGIDKLFSNASAYYDAFYTEAEKNAAAGSQIAQALAAVNLQMPTSRDGFRALVEAQMKLGAQGAEAVSVLLGVAGAFAQITPEGQAAMVDLDAYRSALTEAYNAESQALQATITRMGSFAASLRELRNSALLGGLSPLSPAQKYAEAKSQYEAVLAAARGGDESAQGRYQDAYTAFLEASRVMYASSIGYRQDFDYAQAATEEAAKWAEAQVDVGQAQLDSLKASVSGLIEVNKSVLSVREAILQLNAAISRNTAPLTAVAPPVNTPIPYSSYGTSNTEALVAEVKALRTEVSGLRADANRQTGDIIRGGAAASESSATMIAKATASAVKSNLTQDRVAPE